MFEEPEKRALLKRLAGEGRIRVFGSSFGISSRRNNYEELAYETVRLEIDEGDCPYGASDFSISVASRDCMSEIIYL